ncbi:MAG: NDP-sugar synthase [Myxococcales bacterium]|nr:NDP-sugar synthase [Myxococcales bacterium]
MMLAAGLGTRLWPLTHSRAKPAIPFLGRPLIRGMVDWLVSHGVQELVVNTHHSPESIQAALHDVPEQIRVVFSHEPTILGTAGCLAQALHRGFLRPDRTTLVVNAKLFTTLDLSQALKAHRARQANITMMLRTNHHREAFTTIRQNHDGRVLGFGPSRVPEGENPKLFTGIHFLEPSVIQRAELRFSDSIQELYPPELQKGRVWSYTDDTGHWLETSTLERYLHLQLALLKRNQIHQPKTAIINKNAQIACSVLGDNVKIGKSCITNAIILNNAVVEDGASVENAILGEGVHVPKDMDIKNAVAVPSLYGAYPENLSSETIERNNMTIVTLRQSPKAEGNGS